MRHGVTHDVLACWFSVDRSTVTRAVGEIRPLLAERGCHVAPGLRFRTLADVIAHLGTTGQTGIIDATEVRVRCPAANRPDRNRFVSGKSRMNAMKALVVTDGWGRVLFCGEARAGSVADITQGRDVGLVDLLADTIHLEILADAATRAWVPRPAGRSSPCPESAAASTSSRSSG
ncbi:transposase [Streptacidiphilus sp. PB12-B1b]|uniref:transposase n=1 Tax=Streptacidiphilus sp. PB12-B1b TaxID=2705012 RepID=UPI0021071C14|nr:transposase [Streptacidiphilus sp. PB12-B1b]